jgi:hypothetical protein
MRKSRFTEWLAAGGKLGSRRGTHLRTLQLPRRQPEGTGGTPVSPTQGPAEFGVLCSVARITLNHSEIATALKGDIDWDALLSLAEAHGVRPQLIRAFRELDWIGVPSEIKRSLLDFLQVQKVRSLFIAGELIQVTDQFSQRGIRFATFKGPSLAAALYGDLSLRECNDIDIIIDKQHVAQAEAVLGSLGYRAIQGSSVFRDAFLSYQKQFAFVRESPRLAVDLHWDFIDSYVSFPISPAEIWSNLEEFNMGGWVVPTLGRNDLALFLAGHGTKEGWRCLSWVGDFAMFIEKHPDLDWHHLLVRAQRRGCGRSLLLGCHLAARLLGTQVKIDTGAENAGQSLLTAETILHRLRNEFPAASLDRELGSLELCENWLQKARAIGKLFITRTVGDYVSMPLPRPFWRVYHVTRPFRLAWKVIIVPGSIISRERRRKLQRRCSAWLSKRRSRITGNGSYW